MVKASSVIEVKIYDNKNVKKKDLGDLGKATVLIGDILDMERGGDGIV
jgi:hypothetical protein